MCSAILNCLLSSFTSNFLNQLAASRIDFFVTSLILRLSIFTHKASSFNLLPLQLSQSESDWYSAIASLFHSLSDSRNLLSKLFITPSKVFL